MSKPNILLISLYDSSALSIRCLHSVLKEAKYPVEMVFLKELVYNQMKKPTEKELNLLINITNKIKPDIIAMSVRSPFFEIAKEITQLLKKETGKMMVWGGIHPTILPNESIKHADIICIGEGEEAFLELVQNLETNKDISKIKNLWIRTNGKIIKNGIRPLLENLDKIPLPEYSNGGKYYINLDTITSKDPYLDYNKYYPMAGRGCPFSCTFCINSYLNKLFKSKGKIMRRRSVDNLLQELAIVKTKFKNLKEIFFVDEVFVLDRQWLFEFIDKYKQVNIPFQCEFYPTTVKEDIISKLKKIGLINVNMGIQSGSNRVRTEIYKRTTPDKVILNAAHIFKKHKIVPTYDIIVDNPYETKEDMEESTKFLLKLPRPYNLNIFSLIHFPKTELTEKFKSDRYITCSNSEKALKQWRMTFNVKRESANAHYNCLVSLLSKSFVPKPLIKSFSNSNYFKKNPSLLIYFVKFCNNLKLAITGIKLTLNGRMTLARIKRQIRTHKGVTN